MDIRQEALQIEQKTKEEFIQLDGVLQMRVIRFIASPGFQEMNYPSVVSINETCTDIMAKLLDAMFVHELSKESFHDLESQMHNARLKLLDKLNFEV